MLLKSNVESVDNMTDNGIDTLVKIIWVKIFITTKI